MLKGRFIRSVEATNRSIADIGIVMAWARRSIYKAIAKRLRERFGTRVHLYVATETEAKGLREQEEEHLWSSITCWNVLNERITDLDLDEATVIARARYSEVRLGETTNRLTFSHRQLGRGHSPGSYHYPRSTHFERASYVQVLHGYNESVAFWEKEITDKGLNLIIDGDKLVSATTRMMGVPFRRMIGSRYKNYWFWTPDEYQSNPAIEPVFRALKEWNTAELTEGYPTSTSRSSSYYRRVAFPNIIRRSSLAAAQYLWWLWRGYERVENFNFWNIVLMPYREGWRYRQTRRIARATINDLGDMQFAYFPLHKEPETSFLTRSPNFTNQHAAIMAVARDLPAGVQLVVKENLLSIGTRPSSFLPQLAELRNVILLDVHESGIEAIRRCAFVATITGTAGLEAAGLGKPVLTFTPHVTYAFLDHVKIINGFDDLRKSVSWALSFTDQDNIAARQNGARFFEALKRASFDMADHGVEVGIKKFDNVSEDMIETVFDALLNSLDEFSFEQQAVHNRA